MRLLAIDFGTSNTVAALLVDGQAPRTVTFDTSPLLPSAVFLGADGQYIVGRDAQRQARLDPARYEPNPKRRVDDGEILLGDRVVPVVDVIAAVLRVVATEVRRQLGGAAPDEVRLTHPAQWGAIRQNVLVAAARAAGLGTNLLLIPEPVAAAAQFTRLPGRALPPGGTVAVYDLGGGTFDIAIVGRTQGGAPSSAGPASRAGPAEAEFHVLAEAGLPDLGGLDFDQAILDQVGRSTSSTDPGRWQQILRPVDSASRRAARALAEDVRAAKEALSRYPQTDVSLPDPFVDAHLTRTEFEGLIRPNLLRSIEVLSTVLKTAGLAPERLGGIFLVGGSSRIPLVAGLIQDRLHVTPVALDQPETAVALGALLVPVNRASNRTVGLADRSSPFAGRPAGSPTGPHATPLPPGAAPSPPGGSAASTGPTHSVRSGSAGSPVSPDVIPPSADRGGRRRLLLAGALVVLVLAGAVLLIVRTFGSTQASGPAAGPTAGHPTSATAAGPTAASAAGPTPATAASVGPATAATSTGSVVATTGLGPGKAFTAGEVAFMSNNVDRLTQCSEYTSTFNGAPEIAASAGFKVSRAVRCAVATADEGNLYGSVLVYVMTVKTPAAADRYLSDMYKAKVADQFGGYKQDSDVKFTNGAGGRVITASDLPTFGQNPSDPTQGASVLAWTSTGRPYVGIVVSLPLASQSALNSYWVANYKPRN